MHRTHSAAVTSPHLCSAHDKKSESRLRETKSNSGVSYDFKSGSRDLYHLKNEELRLHWIEDALRFSSEAVGFRKLQISSNEENAEGIEINSAHVGCVIGRLICREGDVI
jgi:hypothetical protein